MTATNILTTPAIDFVAFSARFSTHEVRSKTKNQSLSMIIARNNGIPNNSVGNYILVPL